jgi:alkyl hydroperoxide reductase subunit D
MSLDALRESLPAYARDLSLNLSSLEGETTVSDQQRWGVFVASAHAVGVGPVIRAVEAAAAEAGLSEEAKARLRMNIIANPGVEKTDFELWSLAVSAINGCDMCMDAHEGELKKRGLSNVAIQAALRIAAVVNAVSRVVAAEAAAVA